MTSSVDRLEYEAESSRARVSELLDELRRRITPGEVVDQVMDFAGVGVGGDLVRTLGRQVRNNPLACTVIGAGLAWLMLSDRRGNGAAAGSATGLGRAAERATERAASYAAGVSGTVSETAADAAWRTGSAATDLADRGKAAMSGAAGRAGPAASDLSANRRAAPSGAARPPRAIPPPARP